MACRSLNLVHTFLPRNIKMNACRVLTALQVQFDRILVILMRDCSDNVFVLSMTLFAHQSYKFRVKTTLDIVGTRTNSAESISRKWGLKPPHIH